MEAIMRRKAATQSYVYLLHVQIANHEPLNDIDVRWTDETP